MFTFLYFLYVTGQSAVDIAKKTKNKHIRKGVMFFSIFLRFCLFLIK